MKRTLILLAFFIAMFFQTTRAAGLSVVEKQIQENVVRQQAAQLALLEQLVNINSGTNNVSGVRQVGDILQAQFQQLGFTTHFVDEPSSMQRAGTLVAERKGHGKKIILIGHLDTVFSKDSPFQKFARQTTTVTGPGVIDDKGGDVVILYALKALAAAHALDDTNITIVLTGDEEDSGKPTSISRQPLFTAAKNTDVALDFEWAITSDTATVARRGILDWMITTTGHNGHSFEIFQKNAGDGAIFELSRILDTMRIQMSQEKYLSFNPGLMLGGTSLNARHSEGEAFGKTNVIAAQAMAQGDLRYLTLTQKINAEKNMQAIVAKHLPETNAAIQFQEGIPAMQETANNLALLKKYSAVSEDLNAGAIHPLDPGLRGAADISHIAADVPANLAGLGALGTGAHSTMETIQLASLPVQTTRAAIFIYRLTYL
jgi:glutamate carboxypeptidase